MENSGQNEMLQIKNLIKEFNNNIIQINEKIIIINNIITRINNIMNKNKDKVKQIENFMESMKSFKFNPKEFDKNNEPYLFRMKNLMKVEDLNEEGLEIEAIETVMKEGKCTREQAIKALRKHNGDPVEALIDIDYDHEEKNNNSSKKEDDLNNKDRENCIKFIMDEGHCSREDAIKALDNHNWDPVEALLNIAKSK
jgi:NACalpha-BTF3-like transcription factor